MQLAEVLFLIIIHVIDIVQLTSPNMRFEGLKRDGRSL